MTHREMNAVCLSWIAARITLEVAATTTDERLTWTVCILIFFSSQVRQGLVVRRPPAAAGKPSFRPSVDWRYNNRSLASIALTTHSLSDNRCLTPVVVLVGVSSTPVKQIRVSYSDHGYTIDNSGQTRVLLLHQKHDRRRPDRLIFSSFVLRNLAAFDTGEDVICHQR